jgi:hypothetical protein
LRVAAVFAKRHPDPVLLIPLVALLGVLARDTYFLSQGVDFLVRHVTFDDTYYYLNTAWQARHVGFVTFDGINPTNGVQFVWFWILYLYSFVWPDRISFFYAALVLCSLIGLLAVPLAYRIGHSCRGRTGGAMLAVVVAFGIADGPYLRALENTLQVTVFLVTLDQYLRFLHEAGSGRGLRPERLLGLFALFCLHVWTRIDSAPISAVLGSHVAWVWLRDERMPQARRWGFLMVTVLLCAVAAGILFWGNYAMGGSAVPVSGLWKRGHAEWAEAPELFVHWWGRSFWMVIPLRRFLGDGLLEWIGVGLTMGAVLLALRRMRCVSAEGRAVEGALVVIVVALLAHSAAMMVSVEPEAMRRGLWYQGPYMVTMGLMLTSLLTPKASMGEHGSHPLRRLEPLAAGLAILVLAGFGFMRTVNHVAGNLDRTNFHGERLEVARWIEAHLPVDARLGAYNSGELGYFSERSVTNLDGLINSYDYYLYRRDGGSVAAYLLREGIEYYVDYFVDPEVDEISTVVYERALPEGGAIRIRRIESGEPQTGENHSRATL